MSIQQITTEYIAINPDYCYGKPRIAGTIMPVAAIAEMYLDMKQSVEEIAQKYDLSLAQVHGAMAYYFEHWEDIDRHTIETDRLVEEIKVNNPTSKFQQKWRQITGER
ncbi:MAG: DUF433 domain-containing protein [Moorea sp. SIOASIH]|uniref:DUF433 domain-containing protein n=1 Tax=Moorena sp. SIOASIH TaxID=2607817 RepID=UPI0013BA3022|nr:DUF433 domain-containing protein [Moorena sp. SIOASIH]NEO38646.1 DUF433 domain-containing protein [Moorena sp. SIOASIH]